MNQAIENKKKVRAARVNFVSMAVTYCLGVFNDNFFKQAAMLLAVTLGMSHLQGWATLLFALPFILFSSTAGWVADRFAKRQVVIGAKALECLAMVVGAVGLVYGNWACILSMVFAMGMQSAFFSPALNGAIPELYPRDYVPKANGVLKTVSTLAVLAGIAAAGITLDAARPGATEPSAGKILVAGIILLVSVMGFLAGFGVYSKPAQAEDKPFPIFGPLSSLQDLCAICKDSRLFLAVAAEAYFYFIASLVILTINTLGLQQLGLSRSTTSLLSVSLMLGVCAGSLVIARFTRIERWNRYLAPACAGMAMGLLMAAATVFLPATWQTGWLATGLAISGVWAGIFIIPVASFLQVYPKSNEKGRVLAASNFCSFVGILCSGMVFNFLDHSLSPALTMGTAGLGTLGAAVLLALAKKRRIKKVFVFFVKWFLSLRYTIEIKGLDAVRKDDGRGIVFLPNHPALIDPVIVMAALYPKFDPRPLVDKDQAAKPVVRQVMKLVQPVTIPDINKNGRKSRERIKEAMGEIVDNLNNHEQVILYPAGRLYRSGKEDLAGNSGVEYVLTHAPDTRVVLVRTKGLWGSSFSVAQGGDPSLGNRWKRYVGFFMANLAFFGPRRKVTVELVEDRELKRLKGRKAINAYLEAFYNGSPEYNTHVPYFRWKGRTPVILPEPARKRRAGGMEKIPPATRALVIRKIEEMAGQQVRGRERLAHDLAMDSLMIMELAVWLENEFGSAIGEIASLETVDDCILAAGGRYVSPAATGASLMKPSKGWLNSSHKPLHLPGGDTVTALFLEQARRRPGNTVIADAIAGCKSFREITAAIFLLKPVIERIKGERVGIMLPASVGGTILFFTTLFSNKTPVMFNWTVGVSAMAHGLEQTGVTHVLTAKALYQRIQAQGVDLSSLETGWIFLEDIAAKATWKDKVAALVKAVFGTRSLAKVPVPETAAVLFTSGSESHPKAVPLSHQNILANLNDFTSRVSLKGNDSLVGMLPPFHSLGLTGTVIMPLCMGLKTVYHANPTESAHIARIIETYQATTMIGTPTFLNNILQAGTPGRLKSLKLVFTGAEKCPEHVYESAGRIIPGATLCEGYGITECSPLVSLNTAADNHPGTIGKVMPSLEYAVVDIENNRMVKKGDRGILLLRGPSVFSGYLNGPGDKGFYEFNNKRWYYTGDFVRENPDRTLSFCGRKKRFIKLGGEMISLPAIEKVLQETYANQRKANGDGGPLLAIEASPREEYPEIHLFSTVPVSREEVNRVLKGAGLSPLHNIRTIVRMGEIPVLGTGKTDYKQLKRMLVV